MTKLQSVLINLFITGLIMLLMGVIIALFTREDPEGALANLAYMFIVIGGGLITIMGIFISLNPLKEEDDK
jgi:hypothetical protein